MVLLSAQGMDGATIANVAFTSEDRVRDVICNFNADGSALLMAFTTDPEQTMPGLGV
jgi:hypothetical protein